MNAQREQLAAKFVAENARNGTWTDALLVQNEFPDLFPTWQEAKSFQERVLKDARKELRFKVNPEYRNLVPELSEAKYHKLKNDIKLRGMQDPIITNSDRPVPTILDGHHRFRICQELGLNPDLPKHVEVNFSDPLDEKEYVILRNLMLRRNMKTVERCSVGLPLWEIEKERSRIRMSEGGKNKGGNWLPPLEEKRSRDRAAEKVEVSGVTLYQFKTVNESGDQELISKMWAEALSIKQAYLANRAKKRKQKGREPIQFPDKVSYRLILGDFRKKGREIHPNSVSFILTDPPYGSEYLNLWGGLGQLSKRTLMPGGFLIAYAGQGNLHKKLRYLSQYLNYFWTFSLLFTEQNVEHHVHVFNWWKPLLVFYKPPLQLNGYIGDLIKGTGPEKDLHPWQQSEADISRLIEYFCPIGGTVLDPMAGSGTTLAASLKLGRSCIGIDIDPANIEVMKRRLGDGSGTK